MILTLSILASPALFGAGSPDANLSAHLTEVAATEASGATLQEVEDPLGNDFRVWWDQGLRLKTNNGKFALKFGGRIHLDWHWLGADDEIEADKGDFVDGTEIRRGRIELSGTIYGNFDYRAAYEFAEGDADFRDAYVALNHVGPGTVRVGQFFEPFSLEQLTSSNHITFLERALPTLFNQMRSSGAMYYGNVDAEAVTWAIGVFRNVDDYGNSEGTPDGDDGEYSVTGRLTWAPVEQDGGAEVVHVGVGLSQRAAAGDTLRFSQRDENHFGPRVLDTGTFESDGYQLIGLESAWVHGPLALQAEYIRAMTDTSDGTDPDFGGYSIEASYFLTGEHRNYNRKSGSFSGITPGSNYGDEGGTGAWEIGLRYSTLDLSDEGIEGGELDDVTLGVNWYLNPNARVMLNYIDGHLDDDTSDGDIEALAMRFQVNF